MSYPLDSDVQEDVRTFSMYQRLRKINPYAYYWCCQTNENSHQIAGAALIYALNSWRHSVRAAARFSLKLSRE